jgi:hypothetical protein
MMTLEQLQLEYFLTGQVFNLRPSKQAAMLYHLDVTLLVLKKFPFPKKKCRQQCNLQTLTG